MSPRSVADSNVSLQSELGELDSPQSAKGKQKETKTCDQGQVTDSINVREFATATSNSISVFSVVFMYFHVIHHFYVVLYLLYQTSFF